MKTKRVTFRSWIRHWRLHLMALPAITALVIFNYIPLSGYVMAFQKLDLKKGIFKSPWVGLKNFEFLFTTSDAWIITRNTVLYNLVFIVLGMFFAVVLAVLMSELTWKRWSKTLQTVLIMPHFLSMVAVSMVVYAFFSPTNGFINSVLGEQVNWYGKKEIWPFLLTVVHLWKHVGYDSIIYMAVISGISTEHYEAACLDGATKLQQAWYITFPHLKTIICINLIRKLGGIFDSDFGLFYTVPQDSGAIYSVTQVLDTYIFRGLTTLNNPGMSTAASLYKAVVGFVLVLIVNKIVSKIDRESAMF